MIVVCPNCNKKFNIDEKLIPEKGRLLKCSSCNHTWHYTLPIKDEIEIIKKDNNYEININEEENNQLEQKPNILGSKSKLVNNDEVDNEDKNLNNKNSNVKKSQVNSINILSLLIVFLITFTGIIFLIDTFKLYIANFFPNIITILNSLYATLHDLILFFKDLFN